MGKLFVLVKRKGAKNFTGAIRAKPNVSKARLQMVVRKSLKKGFIAKVVTEAQLKSLVKMTVSSQVRKQLSKRRVQRVRRKPTKQKVRRKVQQRTRRVRRRKR